MNGCTCVGLSQVTRLLRKRARTAVARKEPTTAVAHDGRVTGILPTPDGLHWLTAGTDNRLRLWDAHHYYHLLVNYPQTFNSSMKVCTPTVQLCAIWCCDEDADYTLQLVLLLWMLYVCLFRCKMLFTVDRLASRHGLMFELACGRNLFGVGEIQSTVDGGRTSVLCTGTSIGCCWR